MKTLPGYGRINWAITSANGKTLHCVATAKGVWSVEHAASNSIYLLTAGDACDHEKDAVFLGGWRFCHGGKVATGRNRYVLYVRPGYALTIKDRVVGAEVKEAELRFGEDSHEFTKDIDKVPLAVLPRKAWKAALANAGMRLSRSAPVVNISRFGVEEYDEDSSGSFIHNRITGFVHSNPDGNMHLDDGFFWSDRSSCWMGAAIYDEDGFPEVELKLFFAALKPSQRFEIAKRLEAGTFDCRLIPSYSRGQGIEFMNEFKRVEFTRSTRHSTSEDDFDENVQEIFDDAINYLCTLRPGGKTKEQAAEVLKCLQQVETGIARYEKTSASIQGYQIIDHGGRMSVGGENHGTRLVRLLKMGRIPEIKRAVLQKRWQRISDKQIASWEALEVKTLAADYGIAPYISRQWIAESISRRRVENTRAVTQHLEYLKQEAEAKRQYEKKIASRKDEDVFVIVPADKAALNGLNRLEVQRDGVTVESYGVCCAGTRLFCSKTGMNVKHTYTRAEIRDRLTKLWKQIYHAEWFKSHNFSWLLKDIGIMPDVSKELATAAA